MVIEIQDEFFFVLLAVIVVVIFVLLLVILKFQQKYRDALNQLDQRGKESRRLGMNVVRGEINEILGTFSLLNEYEELILLSTSSGNSSMDLIGRSQDSLDFIEIKTKGAKLTPGEKKVRRLIEEKRVKYRVVDAELPSDFKIEDREQPNSST